MNNVLTTVQSYFATGVGSIVRALLLLLLAWIVASAVRTAVRKLLGTKKISETLAKADPADQPGATAEYIAKFVYLLVFLLFVPGIMSALHADSVGQPVLNLLNTIWGYVPNVIAAAIVLWVGLFVARMVRQILVPVFQKLRVDKLQEKAGMEITDSGRLSNTLAYIVYVFIVVPVITVALEVLNIEAISAPAVEMLGLVFNYIPIIFVAALIIILGCIVAKFCGQIVERLIAATGFDAKLTELTDGKTAKFVLSRVVGVTIQTVLTIFFVAEGLNVLGLSVLSDIGTTIIGYMPNVLAAAIIFVCAVFAARMAEKALNKTGLGWSVTAKAIIYTVAGFMILNQLGIAAEIVNSAFILIMVGLAIAFAIAFGTGGKEFAAGALKKLTDKAESDKQAEK